MRGLSLAGLDLCFAYIIRLPDSKTMSVTIEGQLNAGGLRLAVIASRFNDEIVEGLLDGALKCLKLHGADTGAIEVYRVPGAFEIPALASKLASLRRFDALVTIGVLLRGETPHFDFIAMQVTLEISRVAIEFSIPVSFGVITCNTLEQARARSGPGSGNKGWEAALAAVEMATLFRQIR